MDLVLRVADEYFLDSVWARLVPNGPTDSTMALHPQSAWPRDYIPRRTLSAAAISLIVVYLIYFVFGYLSFRFLFNHKLMQHPRFHKGQVKFEILTSLKAVLVMVLLSVPWFQIEIMGYSQLYDDVSGHGWLYFIFSIALFFVFTDTLAYWIHRSLHHPMLYKRFHEAHHKSMIPTPFASLSLHPVEGHLQALTYHLPILLFPIHRGLYVSLIVFANIWGIIIHDTDLFAHHPLERFINGPTHHALHHVSFVANYGQFFTWADRMGGTYRHPGHHNISLQVAGKTE